MKCLLLSFTAMAEWYEPAGRTVHSIAVVGESLFLWAGKPSNIDPLHARPLPGYEPSNVAMLEDR